LEVERYSDPQSFAREVNLPLIGIVRVTPILAGAQASTLLEATDPEGLKPAVEALTQTRKSLTLRSLFLTGFPHDPEFFASGLALAREWSREGLKVAVVDLDYRHPTVVRPRPDPNEGYVDALEYGCSFQRVGWELVADSLWLVGPGSHPTDGERFAAHPDWARVMRIFSSRVDVTLYLAPFLDRKGFTGRLSKRMDGVLLAASVQRASRAALRDAFLELWSSDAPMIGCLGIAVPHAQPPKAAMPMDADVGSSPAPERTGTQPDSIGTGSRERPGPVPPRRSVEPPAAGGDVAARALVTKLSDEVRQGRLPRVGPQRSRALFFIVVTLLVLAAGGAFVFSRMLSHRGAQDTRETLPAGTERVLPADGGTANRQGLPQTNGANLAGAPTGGSTTPPEGTGSAAETPTPGADESTSEELQPATPPPAPTRPAGSAQSEAPTSLPYRVHIASFRSESKVREMVKSLRARGIGAWYAAASDQPGWYRVFVGHYATHEEAARKAAWLLRRGLVDRAMAYPDNER
jgi:cell division septation protein DedD